MQKQVSAISNRSESGGTDVWAMLADWCLRSVATSYCCVYGPIPGV